MAVQKDLSMPLGDNSSFVGVVTDPNNNNAPVNLTGKTVVFTMKSTPPLVKNLTVLDPAAGTIRLGPFIRADTVGAGIASGSYAYDIVVITGGEHLTAQFGTFFLTYHPNP